MRIILFFVLTFSFISSSYACMGSVMSTTKKDGTQIGVSLNESMFSDIPDYSPLKGEPPLSISEASKIAIKWAREHYSRYDDVTISSVNLKEYGCSETQKKWYYMFEFEPSIDGNILYGSGNWAAVLFNGKLIPPTKIEGRGY